jgi:arsenite methyltransferase
MINQPFWQKQALKKRNLEIVQINLGDICNQACTHCHIEASPKGKQNMSNETAEKILKKLIEMDVQKIEFTGGAPEMNPNLPKFIEELSKHHKIITVRTNLTILEQPEYQYYYELYKKHKVKLVASLPSTFADTTDRQRGRGVFNSSIRVLKRLNDYGFGTNGLMLDFVHNPVGEFLPPAQQELEYDYKEILGEKYDIKFNKLYAIVNSPITRYKSYLKRHNKYDDYLQLLKEKYNNDTLEKIMCRDLINVDYLGYVYDCDFNFAANMRIKGYENTKFWEIDFNQFYPEIAFADHCYACTVNNGSSCHGVLIPEEQKEDLEAETVFNKDSVSIGEFDVKNSVQKYYGEEIQQTADLKTTACCTLDEIPTHIRKILPLINDEIKMKYYGCGTAIPSAIEGLNILDVGCGSGRDSYVMSKLVGEDGFVFGIDMTKEQIEIAQKYVKDQTARYEYKKPNVKFIHDYMENLNQHFELNSMDLITSNCVINLAEDKELVIKQIYELLRDGGELYFSDVYVDQRLPQNVRKNEVLYGECLGGALYFKDFERLARRVGFNDPRKISQRIIEITDEKIKNLVGNATFYSTTYRLWKIEDLEDACEDFGHIAIYQGGLNTDPVEFELDEDHIFEKNRPERVCGNTALMLSKTRFRKYFNIIGNFDEHFGLFESCGTLIKNVNDPAEVNSCSC